MSYNFIAEWCKGSKNDAPDALSQSPVSDSLPNDALAELDTFSQPEMLITEIRAFHIILYVVIEFFSRYDHLRIYICTYILNMLANRK